MLTPIKLDAAEYVNFTGMYRNSSNYIHICKYVIKIYDYIYYQDASSLVQVKLTAGKVQHVL